MIVIVRISPYNLEMKKIVLLSLFISSLLGSVALAQGAGGGSALEIILEGGAFLPDQVDELTEILGFLSVGLGLATGSQSYLINFANASGEDSQINNLGVEIRKSLKLQTISAIVSGGLDVISLKRPGFTDTTYFVGAHVAGGLMALVSKGLYLRMNMRFNGNPGVMMFLGFGLMYRPSEDN